MRSSRFRIASRAGALLAAGLALLQPALAAVNIDSLWEYDDPAASEARLRAQLVDARGDDRLELLTQVARTDSLRGRFAEAHRVLDEVERELPGAGARPRIRYRLERGRCYNSAGDRERARPLFVEAYDLAREAKEEGLAVDAAHMVAITWEGTERGLEWNRRGLALARGSHDAKARALVPAMLNNCAWDLHALGRYEEALAAFEEAEREWAKRGGLRRIEIANWSVARCLRSLNREEDALAILTALEAAQSKRGEVDPQVLEEIAADRAALNARRATP